jgi:hypothetical protein
MPCVCVCVCLYACLCMFAHVCVRMYREREGLRTMLTWYGMDWK